MIPATWIDHRRGSDREVIGYIAPDVDQFVPMSLLGTPLAEASDWLEAVQRLEETGLRWLLDPCWLRRDDGTEAQVVIVELDREKVVLAEAATALVVGAPRDSSGLELSLPTDRLRPVDAA